MVPAAIKKSLCLFSALTILATFLTVANADTPQTTVLPTATVSETPAEPTITPTPGDNVDPIPYTGASRLSCVPGIYEELDVTDGWKTFTDPETNENIGFSRDFYIEKINQEGKNNGVYFLRIADFKNAYSLFINGTEIPANTVEYRIDEYVREGINEIVIAAEKITGEIRVIYTPPVVLGGISVLPNPADGTVTVDVSVLNMTDESYAGSVEVSVYELGKIVNGSGAVHTGVASADMKFDAIGGTTCLVNPKTIKLRDFDDSRKWSLENPFMYEVTARLGENSLSTTFKICDVSVDRDIGYVTVNGFPIFINALIIGADDVLSVSDVGDFFNESKAEKVNMLIADGVTIPQSWYESADECGILVYETKNLPVFTAEYDANGSKFEHPTVCIADEDIGEDDVDAVRASRRFCGIAFRTTEQCRKYCTDMGVAVDFAQTKGGRGELFTVGVSVINDKNVDMTTATAVLEIKSGGQVQKSETKEYESLKKLGTEGRDVMTRDFSFTLPQTLKDGTEVELTVTVDYDGEKTVRTKTLVVEGGDTYEAPYSDAAVIITIVAMAAVIGGAALVAGYRYRHQMEKRK